jgi:hypothetical protein
MATDFIFCIYYQDFRLLNCDAFSNDLLDCLVELSVAVGYFLFAFLYYALDYTGKLLSFFKQLLVDS